MTGQNIREMGQRARAAARVLLRATTEQKNAALTTIADLLQSEQERILAANAADMEHARATGTAPALLDRMALTPERLVSIRADTRRVAELPDPVGTVYDEYTTPGGLHLHKRRVPFGVVGIIYEARPNVTVDAAILCLKTSNAVMLRGGSDITHSVAAITTIIGEALRRVGLPADAVQSITDPDRARVIEMLHLDQYIDVIVPRGGAGLHRLCREQSTIPVITGGIGVCHAYVDSTADMEQAVPVIRNAKIRRPAVCNSLDVLLVQREAAPRLLPMLARDLHAHNVELRADDEAYAILTDAANGDSWHLTRAGKRDFDTEFMALVLAVKLVPDLDAALDHIAEHSTGHSELILTEDGEAAARFLNEVDSSAVFHNASTGFNDGGQFGLGAELAVSTQKMHVRGPMALHELTTYKWVATGNYLTRG